VALMVGSAFARWCATILSYKLASKARPAALPLTGFVLLFVAGGWANAAQVAVQSPNGKIRLIVQEQGRLDYRVLFANRPVIETSPLGISVDGVDLGQGARLGEVERYQTNEKYPWRGVHSEAVDRSNGARISAMHVPSQTPFTIDVRVFDDAAAFRLVVPGGGRRVPDAATAFRLPANSTLWCAGARDHYEGPYLRKALNDVAAGEWATPPLTIRLPGIGYASITEADLRDYAGMMLQGDGKGAFHERLGHSPPASYPYTLRYGEENAKRLSSPAPIWGTITTPWRVVLVGTELGALVNSDAIHNLCPAPSPTLFPKGMRTEWLRPGRAVWRYLDGPPIEEQGQDGGAGRGERGLSVIREFSRQAGELGFEHQIVEGLWRHWSDEQIRELVEYSKQRGVSIWFWLHSRDHRDPEGRREVFRRLHQLGVAGIKMDFFDHEAKELIDLYQAVLKDAAEYQLLVLFHGANKPTGESRTWPNEMTREGIRGLEHGRTAAWAEYNTTVPFARFLAGPADYTPVIFGDRRKDTTWAHQIATAIVFTSPLMVYAANPKSVLENPAVEVIKSIPSVWDETVVLPGSEIGETAAFARRSGERWFLGVLNGPNAHKLKVNLSFLKQRSYRATTVRDKGDGSAVEIEQRTIGRKEVLELELRPGGGFVARFSPQGL